MQTLLKRVLSAALLLTASSMGQTPPLTLEECVRLATAAQSTATVANQELTIARLGVRAARSAYFPQLQLQNGYNYNSPTAGNGSFIALNGTHEYISLLSAALQIDTSGRVRAEVARARADQQAADVNLRIAGRDLKRQVATAYYRLALTRRLVDVARSSLDEATGFEKRTKLLTDAGEAARADLVKASSETAFMEQALSAAELDAETANHELAAFWTVNVDQRLEIVDPLATAPPRLELPGAAGSEFMRRLEFNLYDAQRKGFLADYRRARADLLPQAGVTYQYGIDAPKVDWAFRGHAVLATLNVPIFDWFHAISLARQAKINAEIVETNIKIAERNFSKEYQGALARVKSLYTQIDIARRQVDLGGENLKLARIRYEGGEGLALDVVAAQTQAAQASTNYYTAIANYLNAKADLEVASGR